jgi:hypothetical protein
MGARQWQIDYATPILIAAMEEDEPLVEEEPVEMASDEIEAP